MFFQNKKRNTRSGALVVKAAYAMLIHDTEVFGRMSPFLVVKVGRQAQQTAVRQRGGRNPQWNDEELHFNVVNEQKVHLTVYDHERFKKEHDLVGEASYDLADIPDGDSDAVIEILYKGRLAGSVKVVFEFNN